MTRINTNVPSLVAQNRLQSSNNDLQTALTRLSTGLRINSGADDPAGLIASEALRSEITSLGKAISNTRRASQIISTADSALGEVSNLLNDIRGLVVEAANSGALSDSEIAANQLQVDSSLEAVNRIAQTTTFQGRKLIDGSLAFLTEAGTNFSTVADLQIDQANLGTTGSVSVDVTINAAAEQASVSLDIPVATAGVSATGTLTLDQAGVAAASATGSLAFSQNNEGAEAASGVITLASGGTFEINARDGGAFADAAGNLDIIINTVAVATPSSIDSATPGQITINLEAGKTLQTIAGEFALLASDTDFEFISTDNTTPVVLTTDNVASGTEALSLGTADSTSAATIDVVADATGTAGNVNLVFTKSPGGPTSASINGSGDIEVIVDDTGTTPLEDIRAAIDGIVGFTATTTNTDPIPVGDYDNTAAAPTLTDLTGGVDAITAGTAALTLTSNATGTAANGATITFATATGLAAPTATVNTSGNLTVTVDDASATSITAILNAINTEGTYTAAGDPGDTLTSFDPTNATPPTSTTVAFAGGAASTGGLAEEVVFELQGTSGSEVFNVSQGTSIDELISQINLVSDATGVTATNDGTTLTLTSSAYGSDAVVDLRVIEEEATGTFSTEISAGVRDEGADIVAKVNGVDASGDGNTLKINTATLDLSITVDEGSSANVGFTINGGGALFQLGADVVGNQQARIGINSVNTARLGGPAGKLFQLTSGQSAALATDPNAAAKIVTEAINQVTGLRGRLGAFQATTLDSNLVSLSETQANLLEAESSIRDADFAQESANLTRAQILVQSGTNVLSLANQNPQNVLALLR